MSSAVSIEDLDESDRQQIIEVLHGSKEIVALRRFVNQLAERNGAEIYVDGYDMFDAVDDALEYIEHLEEQAARVEEVEEIAATAHAIADRNAADGDTPSKKRQAALLSRNELLRRLAMAGAVKGVDITNSEVQDMGKPEVNLRWQTVDDAWDDLETSWDAIEQTRKHGSKVLRLHADRVSPDLCHVVEQDLGREDLAKRLVGQDQEGHRS